MRYGIIFIFFFVYVVSRLILRVRDSCRKGTAKRDSRATANNDEYVCIDTARHGTPPRVSAADMFSRVRVENGFIASRSWTRRCRSIVGLLYLPRFA